MTKKSKILVLIVVIATIASVYITYSKTIVDQNFEVVEELE